MPVDPDLQKQLDDIKKIIKAEAVGGLLLLMFFMSCTQCNKLNSIDSDVSYIKRHMAER